MRSASATEVPPNFITSRATALQATGAAIRPRRGPRLAWCAVPSDKRARQRAGRAARMAQLQQAQRQRRRRTRVVPVIALAIALAIGLAVYTGSRGNSK